ncbi:MULTISPECIES: beta-ketoacyl synthase N-terminal-like domain-containing protein [Okeania]|uniref:Polyketide beta-ketoacyl:ACP synthase n=1 Tax=Okeania hirsuta TaxID=1458930 RepID=A0A3N6NN67_9CYAN|nr:MULTISPECIES: beta-ketoacyl synthase N-terminal-like domain-containing protein [Okeania]NET13250.1 polyketide beta-ketoacyl:ACP synthase [Okeania sp. SIO1H6]AZH23802.1 MgcM [Okeania hirsuta]NES76651.1 polyketide beta-ketoacyl:ACP synthase [Okeania sp. SIO1H4]NES88823.1 polyketide beta-ketoacyl:ACP synthase [Okeania sp. SIO2B9]NET20282.1 polyketide beta-ketoacyl:ACP synthase [Okeania sp. SIO1H5]
MSNIEITGMGIVTSIGQGIATFKEALLSGKTQFAYLKQPGRESVKPFIGGEIPDIETRTLFPEYSGLLRAATKSAQVATVAVAEAWQDAQLTSSQVNPERVGLVVGGSNLQQRYQQEIWQRYNSRQEFIRPTYGLTFWDTDILGLISQCFQIQGEGYSVGGASASGGVAIIHAARQILMGNSDICIALGTLSDLSGYELQALMNLGAMGSERFADRPDLACRPFDQDHDGFIYGEGCGVVILESTDHARQRGAKSHGQLKGWGFALDGNRSPEPSQKGEERAINTALAMADLQPESIDYVNTHGTGSPLGDKTEVGALKSAGLQHCLLNSTKSLTGHCLTAAGVVEAIATILQMKFGFCHPTKNLVNPIDTSLNWVKETSVQAEIKYAISNSFGFGGINTALLIAQE